MNKDKLISGFLATILIISFTLLVLRILDILIFWIIIIVGAVYAFVFLPRRRKNVRSRRR